MLPVHFGQLFFNILGMFWLRRVVCAVSGVSGLLVSPENCQELYKCQRLLVRDGTRSVSYPCHLSAGSARLLAHLRHQT